MESAMHRIMLVDDEPNILKALRRVLSQCPPDQVGGALDIVTFERPADALRHAQENALDLVVSDYRMPEMNGIAFLTRMVALQPRVARLILSGHTDLDALVGAINQVQIFRFISKPWHEFELRSTVRQALEYRDLMSENQRLADLVRVQRGELSRQEMELRRLEEQFPGLARR
jgi:DNA-binding NtrC family response regulator